MNFFSKNSSDLSMLDRLNQAKEMELINRSTPPFLPVLKDRSQRLYELLKQNKDFVFFLKSIVSFLHQHVIRLIRK